MTKKNFSGRGKI